MTELFAAFTLILPVAIVLGLGWFAMSRRRFDEEYKERKRNK